MYVEVVNEMSRPELSLSSLLMILTINGSMSHSHNLKMERKKKVALLFALF